LMVFAWTNAIMMAVRPIWLWAGGTPPLIAPNYLPHLLPTLPLVAGCAMLARGVLEGVYSARLPVRKTRDLLIAGFSDADTKRFVTRRLPVVAQIAGAALLATMLMAGYTPDIWYSGRIFLIFVGLLALHRFVLPWFDFWQRWSAWIGHVPTLIRFGAFYALSASLIQFIFNLPVSQAFWSAEHTTFDVEIYAIFASFGVFLAMFPGTKSAQSGGTAKRISPALAGFGILALILAHAVYPAAADCSHSACCFGSVFAQFMAALALALLLAIMLWPFLPAIAAIFTEQLTLETLGEFLASESGVGLLPSEILTRITLLAGA
jgi:hypothetical protein